jgi:hypothetical protein
MIPLNPSATSLILRSQDLLVPDLIAKHLFSPFILHVLAEQIDGRERHENEMAPLGDHRRVLPGNISDGVSLLHGEAE